MEANPMTAQELAEMRESILAVGDHTHRRLLATVDALAAEIARLRARPNHLEEVLQLRRKTERFQREHDRLVRVVREQRAKIEGKPDKWLEAREREESELMSGGYEEH